MAAIIHWRYPNEFRLICERKTNHSLTRETATSDKARQQNRLAAVHVQTPFYWRATKQTNHTYTIRVKNPQQDS